MLDHPATASRLSGLLALWRPALLVAMLAGGQFALERLGIDPEAVLRGLAAHHRGISESLFLIIGAALCFVGVPRQVVAFAAGGVFGAYVGTVLAVAATMLGCAASFTWARRAARDWIQQRLTTRVIRVDRLLADNAFSATLILRLLPVGNNLLLNLVAGVSSVAVGPFLLGSAVGYVPQGLVFAMLGAGVEVGEGVLFWGGVALFAVSAAIGLWLLRRVCATAAASRRKESVPDGARLSS
jgi:uncharacterized membrane protein YdjX (TVP38/TMEM64 family)